MNAFDARSLSKAVAAICTDVQSRVSENQRCMTERQLWWELSACILSSQVPYSLATAAADRVDQLDLLLTNHFGHQDLRSRLIAALGKPFIVGESARRYRFVTLRAEQLARTQKLVSESGLSLRELLDRFDDPLEARRWLVKEFPGVGPKQASMFIRNIGYSYELAVLDRHVLSYMTALGIYAKENLSISSLPEYQRHELALRSHAESFECPIGLLDWAIWIVMRVARSIRTPVTA